MSRKKKTEVTQTTTTVTTTTTTTSAPKEVIDVFVLDRSGSMGGLRDVTISGVNENLARAKADAEKYGLQSKVSILQFDHELNWICQNVDVNTVQPLNTTTYVPRGSTALNDATAAAINYLRELLKGREHSANIDVTITVFTDGYENASSEFPGVPNTALTAMVKEVQGKFGWTLAYAGAGPKETVRATAQMYGFDYSNTLNYEATTVGASAAFADLGTARSMKSALYSKGIKSNIGYIAEDKKDEKTT